MYAETVCCVLCNIDAEEYAAHTEDQIMSSNIPAVMCVVPQERLLLSLLPAHIARVMKAEIIQRLQGPKFGQVENTNNFHNLYVQRHTNVRWVLRHFQLQSPRTTKRLFSSLLITHMNHNEAKWPLIMKQRLHIYDCRTVEKDIHLLIFDCQWSWEPFLSMEEHIFYL